MNEQLIENVSKYKRNEYGLIDSAEYVFNEDGSVNWRKMIKPEFLYVNKGWFEQRNQECPTSIEGLTDKQLLIMLGGIKELAKLRGYNGVAFDIQRDQDNKYISARCLINWFPNYETNGVEVSYEDWANASFENTDSFCHKFLETMACNRAFVRCVRNFLNIHIIGADEIDRSQGNSSHDIEASSETNESAFFQKPYLLLEKTAIEKGHASFEDFLAWLRTQWKSGNFKEEEAKTWKSYSDITPKSCRILSKLLND